MRRLKNRNVLILLVILAASLMVAGIGWVLRPKTAETGPLYLVVSVDSGTYAPIALEHEDQLTLTQGTMVNVIHVTPESVWMESSTCEGQDCVEQGVVTAENRASRVLGNLIICLPNRVQLELFTAEELGLAEKAN